MYDVIIVGAGPAGLFTAYELIENNPKLKILLLDKGKFANHRVCPMKKQENVQIVIHVEYYQVMEEQELSLMEN